MPIARRIRRESNPSEADEPAEATPPAPSQADSAPAPRRLGADAYLSEAEKDRARSVFDKFDKDRSGSIDMWELRDALRELGQEPTVDELVEIIAEIDTDENGVIDFTDFIQLVGDQKVVLRSRDDDSDTLDAFVALGGCEDKSGHVRRELLFRYVACFGLPVGDRDPLADMSTDESGLVDYETFKSMMLAGRPPQHRINPTFDVGGNTFSWRLSAAQNVPWDTERKGRTAPRYHVFGRPADATATATATAADAETGSGSGTGSGSEPRRVERMSTNLMEDGGSAEDDKARQRRKDARRARYGPKYVSPLLASPTPREAEALAAVSAPGVTVETPSEGPNAEPTAVGGRASRNYESQFELAELMGRPVQIRNTGGGPLDENEAENEAGDENNDKVKNEGKGPETADKPAEMAEAAGSGSAAEGRETADAEKSGHVGDAEKSGDVGDNAEKSGDVGDIAEKSGDAGDDAEKSGDAGDDAEKSGDAEQALEAGTGEDAEAGIADSGVGSTTAADEPEDEVIEDDVAAAAESDGGEDARGERDEA